MDLNDRIKVLEPEELQDKIADLIERMAYHYR